MPIDRAKVPTSKMGPDFDPNDITNLIGMIDGDHQNVTEAWKFFKETFGDDATAEQILNFAQKTVDEYGDTMVK